MNTRVDPSTFEAPLVTRQALITRALPAAAGEAGGGTISIVWSTGATVQRNRWAGWDEGYVEYEETLLVTPEAVRLDFLNKGGPFLDSHRSWGGIDSVIGAIVPGSAKIVNGEGIADVRLTSAAGSADMVHKIMEGTIRFVSVGYQVHEYLITKKEGQTERWDAVDWEPVEVSAVPIPADTGSVIRGEGKAPDAAERYFPCRIRVEGSTAAPAAFTRGKTMPPKETPAGETRTAEQIAADLVTAEATRAAAAAAALAAAGNPTPPTAPEAAAIRAGAQADMQTVLDLCSRHAQEPKAFLTLLREGKTMDQIRGAVLDALAAGDPPIGRSGGNGFANPKGNDALNLKKREAMENALMHRAAPGLAPLTDDGKMFRGYTLMELGRLCLEEAGIDTRGLGKMELAMMVTGGHDRHGKAILETRAPGYHTTSDFPNVLANVAQKTLRAAYDSTPRTFTQWAKKATMSDFKPVSRVALGGAPDLIRVPESGEFTYGTMGEAKETYALLTYGRVIAITRQALINDDMGAFNRIPAAFGTAAADLESDIVYGLLAANAALSDTVALFHATHGNLGTAAVISIASLTDMFRKFAAQRGIEGRQIAIPPRHILVPPGQRALEVAQQMSAVSAVVVAGVNPYAGRLNIIEEVRLIPASGEDPWYVTADPNRIDTIEYGYLDGNEAVFTETRTGFQVDGIEIKARHDFAAAPLDYRGMYKNAGLAPS